ncbi:MAG: hypothetical protein H7101_04465 [Deinococcales bacterium]|nr:hypothetical protein [Chitinophagaceae bacterium]
MERKNYLNYILLPISATKATTAPEVAPITTVQVFSHIYLLINYYTN